MKALTEQHIDVTKLIQVRIITSGERTTGWLYTVGMHKFDYLPELELRNVPLVMAPAGVAMLNQVCQWMVDEHKVLEDGDTMAFDRFVTLTFEKLDPLDGQEEEHPRLTITDQAMTHVCHAGCHEH